MPNPELLSPVGNLEKLPFAIEYGADAVYLAGDRFGLRAGAGNFTMEQIQAAIDYAHSRKKKVYITVNIFAHNEDIAVLPHYLESLAQAQADAFLISDPGIFRIARKVTPQVPVHISTQANNTNLQTACFWHDLGASRIVLARELSLLEIAEISKKAPLETEIFVHGAMCMSYSGRCLISNFLTGRGANQGDCTHPCRWQYRLEEAQRPGEYFPIEEDKRGTYFFHSKDLCLLPYLAEVLGSGVASLKIEGRMKSPYYVACVTRVYRQAIDAYLSEGKSFTIRQSWLEELEKVSHRAYGSGFAFGKPDASGQNYENGGYIRGYDFAGLVQDWHDGEIYFSQRNHLRLGDKIEIISPDGQDYKMVIEQMKDADGNEIEAAPHPQQIVRIPGPKLSSYSIIRRKARDGAC